MYMAEYVNLQINGRIFPSWVLHNFKQYKLPEIIWKEDQDPCSIDVKLELRKYQQFIGKYLGPGSPYNNILLYHGLGSGKTATCINLINLLWNYDHNYTFVLLIKASLRDDPWMLEFQTWLGKDSNEEDIDNAEKLQRFKHIHFIHYDSPFANRDFDNVMKGIDTTKPIVYFIDEVHNFIRNVYSNMKTQKGKRAQHIYEWIMRDKRENKNNKVIMISATPAINVPFELSLLFNLLRENCLPTSELEFNRTFVTGTSFPILNPDKKNMFIRRILGLVSYYIGATIDLFAREKLLNINLVMSEYQYRIYRIYENMEIKAQERAKRFGKQSQLYKTYTRQASNFVFPYVSIDVNGESRPRPGRFEKPGRSEEALADERPTRSLSEKALEKLDKGQQIQPDLSDIAKNYMISINHFVDATEKYFIKIRDQKGRNIKEDLEDFKEGINDKYADFRNYYESDLPKSKLFEEMYDCSPKMLAIVFYSYASPGKVMVYSNYVLMEGIDMLKVYYRVIGFDDFRTAKPGMGYMEYHGRIDKAERKKIRTIYNTAENTYGKNCLVFILSPSATEGIQLMDIRQEHILEPYWNEVRIQQVIGRGIRQCSHKRLPMNERVVMVYRYKIMKPNVIDTEDINTASTDKYVEDSAKAKSNLIESFLLAMKEAAVDCELFKPHNQMAQSYQCFKFTDESQMETHVGPAFKEDFKADQKYDSGLFAKNASSIRIKVIKIQGVYLIREDVYSDPDNYWYYPKTRMVYDYTTHYPVGKVGLVDNLPNKLDKDTYIISTLINIPSIEGVTDNP